MDTVELVDIDNKPIQPCVFGNGSSSTDRKTDECVCLHVHTLHIQYSLYCGSDGGTIIQSSENSISPCSHIDKEHWVIMQVCRGQEG